MRRSERWAAWAAGLGVVGGVLAAACSAAAVAGAAGPFVYVADTKRDEISQFLASRSPHGALKPLAASTVPAGPFPYTIAVDPQGTSAYATSSASKVYQYTINPATGRLTPKSPATVATKSGETAALAFTPDGTSAYVVGKNISQYSIDAATGDLTPKSPATVATPPNPEPIAVSPNGKYAFVATCGGCGSALQKTRFHAPAGPAATKRQPAKASYLVEYRINPRTGALSPKPIAKVTTGNGSNWIAIAPNGKSVYVATSTKGVWEYTLNPATGELSPKNPETSGGTEHNIVIAPNGKNAYVIDATSRWVSQYRINPRTGTLSPAPVSTATTVLHPEAIALSADGKNAYVTSENDPEMAQYTINPTTGKITAMTPATVKTASGVARPGRDTRPVREISPPQTSLRRKQHFVSHRPLLEPRVPAQRGSARGFGAKSRGSAKPGLPKSYAGVAARPLRWSPTDAVQPCSRSGSTRGRPARRQSARGRLRKQFPEQPSRADGGRPGAGLLELHARAWSAQLPGPRRHR